MKLIVNIIILQTLWEILVSLYKRYIRKNEEQVDRKLHIIIGFTINTIWSYLFIILYIGKQQTELLSSIQTIFLSSGSNCILLSLRYLYERIVHKEKTKRTKDIREVTCERILLFALITVVLEIFVFNYQHIMTRNTKEVDSNVSFGKGLEKIDDEKYKVVSNKGIKIELDSFDAHIDTIYLDLKRYDASWQRELVTEVSIKANDAGNKKKYLCGKRMVLSSVENSRYMKLNLSGDTTEVTIHLEAQKDDVISVHAIKLNTPIKFIIVWERVCILFILLVALYAIRPKSRLYKVRFSASSKKQKLVTTTIIALEAVLLVSLIVSNKSYYEPKWAFHNQYQELARSMSKGNLCLEENVPDWLKELDNPFDTKLREEKVRETGESFLWDHAYHDGKYYVYFGVVPELIFYLPYYLITNKNFNTGIGIAITCVLLMIAIMQLIKAIIVRWFKNISYLTYLIVCLVTANCAGILYFAVHACFYCLPIVMGLFFAITGLCFWIKSIKEDRIARGYLFLGSLCIALVAGCRPQLVLIAFIAFPLFWKEIFEKRNLFSKKSVGTTVLAFVPFVVVAAGLMYYNYARFGSPFDFGANYNLTTNDMTKRTFSGELSIAGIFAYLFQPCNLGFQFPFVNGCKEDISYLGKNIYETMYGGLLICNPILWALVYIKKLKENLKEKKIYSIICFLLVYGTAIILIDTKGAGILFRYLCDFSWLFYLAVTLVIFTVEEQMLSGKLKNKTMGLRKCLVLMTCATLLYNVLLMFADKRAYLIEGNAYLYYKVAYAINFWW